MCLTSLHPWLLIGCVLFCDLLPAQEPALQAGAATSNITPEIGRDIIGGFVPFPSTTIHDELHVRCLVLDDGKTRLALAVCDLLGIDRQVSTEARKLIAARTSIPPEQVLICATHTHSASSALGESRFRIDQALDDYQRFVARRIADGVTRAVQNLRPAELAFGTVDVPEHVFNRRWVMRPGTAPVNPFGQVDMVKMNPPAASANLVEPAGPTDPSVRFVAVREPSGRPIAVFAAYSLHYVGGTGPGHISADYFAVFSEQLKALVAADDTSDIDAPEFVAMLANGTSGDINNINFRMLQRKQAPYLQMRSVGTDLAKKVRAAMSSLKYEKQVSLAAKYREPSVAWRKPTAEQRAWAESVIAARPKQPGDLSFIYAQRAMQLVDYPETTTIPLQTLRIGDVYIGTMPFEVFCETGLEFKAAVPGNKAFMVELAHGYFGYLPTPRHFKLGGYETWIGTNRVPPETSERLLRELLEMTSELSTSTQP